MTINKKTQTLYFKEWIKSGITQIKHLKLIDKKLDIPFLFNAIENKRNLPIQINELKIMEA